MQVHIGSPAIDSRSTASADTASVGTTGTPPSTGPMRSPPPYPGCKKILPDGSIRLPLPPPLGPSVMAAATSGLSSGLATPGVCNHHNGPDNGSYAAPTVSAPPSALAVALGGAGGVGSDASDGSDRTDSVSTAGVVGGRVDNGSGAMDYHPSTTVKLKLCRNYLSGAACPFGDRCVFAHGDDTVRVLAARSTNRVGPTGASSAPHSASLPTPPAQHDHSTPTHHGGGGLSQHDGGLRSLNGSYHQQQQQMLPSRTRSSGNGNNGSQPWMSLGQSGEFGGGGGGGGSNVFNTPTHYHHHHNNDGNDGRGVASPHYPGSGHLHQSNSMILGSPMRGGGGGPGGSTIMMMQGPPGSIGNGDLMPPPPPPPSYADFQNTATSVGPAAPMSPSFGPPDGMMMQHRHDGSHHGSPFPGHFGDGSGPYQPQMYPDQMSNNNNGYPSSSYPSGGGFNGGSGVPHLHRRTMPYSSSSANGNAPMMPYSSPTTATVPATGENGDTNANHSLMCQGNGPELQSLSGSAYPSFGGGNCGGGPNDRILSTVPALSSGEGCENQNPAQPPQPIVRVGGQVVPGPTSTNNSFTPASLAALPSANAKLFPSRGCSPAPPAAVPLSSRSSGGGENEVTTVASAAAATGGVVSVPRLQPVTASTPPPPPPMFAAFVRTSSNHLATSGEFGLGGNTNNNNNTSNVFSVPPPPPAFPPPSFAAATGDGSGAAPAPSLPPYAFRGGAGGGAPASMGGPGGSHLPSPTHYQYQQQQQHNINNNAMLATSSSFGPPSFGPPPFGNGGPNGGYFGSPHQQALPMYVNHGNGGGLMMNGSRAPTPSAPKSPMGGSYRHDPYASSGRVASPTSPMRNAKSFTALQPSAA